MLKQPRRARRSLLIALGAIAAASAGCVNRIDPDLAGPAYPGPASGSPSLDIQVVQRATTLTFTNTTARALPAGRLWVNGWYSRAVEGAGVGETLEFSLTSFRDRHGQAFRSGGFFSTEKPEVVVLAEYQTTDEMLGLVVVQTRQD